MFKVNIAILFVCVLPCTVESPGAKVRNGAFSLQLCSVKETPQATEEEVGAFTKFIEAMGFTGALKYNKWVNGPASYPHLVRVVYSGPAAPGKRGT